MEKKGKICEGEVCIIDDEIGNKKIDLAPELEVSEWLNFDRDSFNFSDYRGKVVLIEVFQMLCPACVTHSLPQAERLQRLFRDQEEVCVVGLHSVFEHHEAMQKESLKTFLYEFRYDFPVAIDKHTEGNSVPETMKKYNLRGTPSLIIIDKLGRVNEVLFGGIDDLTLGVKIGRLLNQTY